MNFLSDPHKWVANYIVQNQRKHISIELPSAIIWLGGCILDLFLIHYIAHYF